MMPNNKEILNLIIEILHKGGFKDLKVFLEENSSFGKEGGLWFSVEIDNPHFFINRGGEGISALNHLVKKIIENKTKEETEQIPELLIDINGFQKKKIENIHAVAHMMAERARYFKSNIEIDPMPAFERRVIHEFLSNATDLKTESEGVGLNRRVVIKYIGSN
jgi:spoIIIJ-associated protein